MTTTIEIIDDTPEIHIYRIRAARWLEAYGPCPSKDHPNADLVCQGRQQSPKYSGCADLAHALDTDGLNLRHKQYNRAPNWKPQVNVARLAYWKGVALTAADFPAERDWRRLLAERIDAGDIIIRRSSNCLRRAEHVECVIARHAEGDYSTAEYGQAAPEIGRLFTRNVYRGTRAIRWWLPLPRRLVAVGAVTA